MENPVSGKAALITGGARRLGREMALHLAEKGWNIALHCHTKDENVCQTAESIKALSSHCEIFSADLTLPEETATLIPQCFSVFPHTELLIHNASVFHRKSLVETDDALLDENIHLHLRAPFVLTREFSKRIQTSGQAIAMVDTKAFRNLTTYFAYTLTKKTLVTFVEMAAKALAPTLRVNGIAPGLILPPPGEEDTYLEDRARSLPLAQRGHPEDILKALDYFLNNPFVTGEILRVDGGEHLK